VLKLAQANTLRALCSPRGSQSPVATDSCTPGTYLQGALSASVASRISSVTLALVLVVQHTEHETSIHNEAQHYAVRVSVTGIGRGE